MAARIHIVLFRGINVGGHKKVPMASLRTMLSQMGGESVKTHVQSGNAVLSMEGTIDLAAIEKAFAETFGFSSKVFLYDVKRWAKLIAANPYPKAVEEPTTLHLFVMDAQPPAAQMQALDEKLGRLTGKQADDEYRLEGEALYLHAPHGLGRSRLAEMLVRTLKVEMTARNWRTVLTLQQMAGEIGKP